MTRSPLLPIVLVGAGALGAGLWLGRPGSSPAPAAPGPAAAAGPAAAGAAQPAGPGPGRRAATSRPALEAPPAGGTGAAGARGASAGLPGLTADLTAADPRVRRAAVRELVRDADADPALVLAASRDPDLEVGVVATEALGKLVARGAVPLPELIARVTDRSLNERVRVSALNGVGLVPAPESAALLTELAARGDVGERRGAAILLVHQEPAAAIPVLIGLLGDGDEYVRSNALESLRARSRGRDFGPDQAAWRAWWAARSR